MFLETFKKLNKSVRNKFNKKCFQFIIKLKRFGTETAEYTEANDSESSAFGYWPFVSQLAQLLNNV